MCKVCQHITFRMTPQKSAAPFPAPACPHLAKLSHHPLQMDGLSQSDEMVFVLAATNLPWELDTAMLRRLEKRILVPLPGGEARLRMLQHLLPPEKYAGLDFVETVEKTAGYSGSDVRLVCKEAAMRPLRRLMSALDEEEESGSDASAGGSSFWMFSGLESVRGLRFSTYWLCHLKGPPSLPGLDKNGRADDKCRLSMVT